MKRSEMVAKIKEFLEVYEDPGFDEEREDDADTLLSIIERIGMLPPSFWKKDSNTASFEWEPES